MLLPTNSSKDFACAPGRFGRRDVTGDCTASFGLRLSVFAAPRPRHKPMAESLARAASRLL